MTSKDFTLTQEYLKDILDYDPNTGVLTWKERPVSHFRSTSKRDRNHSRNIWNARYVKTIAGHKGRNANGKIYIRVRINRKMYLAHRVIYVMVTGEWPRFEIDHKSGVGFDNSWENIADVTHYENMKNTILRDDNSYGITGVSWYRSSEKWRARIYAFREEKYLGYFDDFFEAVCARKSAELKYGFHENHGRPKLAEA